MGIGSIIKRIIGRPVEKQYRRQPATRRRRDGDHDIYFTRNFYARAKRWGLTEAHARLVYHEGDVVKPNMKVRPYKGAEIGIYYFHDRLTNRPVITSIWKRDPW